MRDWIHTTLGQVITLQRGFDITEREFAQGPFPVISSSGVQGYHSEKKVDGPGVVIGRKGTLGSVFYVDKDYWPNSMTLWVNDFHGNDPLFVYYFLKTMHFENYDCGAANPTLNRNHIHPLPVRIPNVTEQKIISDLLGSLDALICKNQQLNAILESISRAVFKSWFIDFDPVRAKAEGRQPFGMDEETAAMFPDLFEDSELGDIPKGWEVKSMGDECQVLLGGTPKTSVKKYWEGGDVNWINSGELNNNRIINATKTITKTALKESATKLLPRRTVVIAITGATMGKISLLEIEAAGNQSIVGVISDGDLSQEFIYYYLNYNIERLLLNSTGSAQPHINRKDVINFKILKPKCRLIKRFNEIVNPMVDIQALNLFKNEILIKTRDILLEKLISGYILVDPSKFSLISEGEQEEGA